MLGNKKQKLAVFDIDGTIFRKNLQFELLDELAYAGVFSFKTRKKIVETYREWLNNRGTYETYRLKLVDLYKKELRGSKKEDVERAARKVANFNHGRIFIFAKKLIEDLRKTHLLLAISGSPVEIVREFNSYLGFDKVFGTIYKLDENGRYTGEEEFSPVKDKASVVKKYALNKGVTLKESVGVGDTESDISFLELVERPIAFNSNLNLYKRAQEEGWEIIVERKDVIYHVNSKIRSI